MCHAQMLNDVIRKARKEHVCRGCKRSIARGEHYRYVASTVDGDFSAFALCAKCSAETEDAEPGECWYADDLREGLQIRAQSNGWRETRAWLREKLKAFVSKRATQEPRDAR
jgi:hypothetical protein